MVVDERMMYLQIESVFSKFEDRMLDAARQGKVEVSSAHWYMMIGIMDLLAQSKFPDWCAYDDRMDRAAQKAAKYLREAACR